MNAPDLTAYDWIVINSSAGKDSQAMLDYVVELADRQGVRDRCVVVHADLGRMEWAGTKDLARRQAERYGVRFEVVKRPQGDLLTHIRARGMWPSSAARYCTSDHKRGQVATLLTKLARETRSSRGEGRVSILNCLGMRAQESPNRAKLPVFEDGDRGRNGKPTTGTNGRKRVDVWHPIHSWTTKDVWARIRAAGVPHHPAYELGMPRLSCCFCIFSPKAALMLAGKHNRALLAEYVAVESEIGHTFRKGFRIAEVAEALDAGAEPEPVQDWTM